MSLIVALLLGLRGKESVQSLLVVSQFRLLFFTILFGLRFALPSEVIAGFLFLRQLFSRGYVRVPFLSELLDHGMITYLRFEDHDDFSSDVAIISSLCLEGVLLQIIGFDTFVQLIDLAF